MGCLLDYFGDMAQNEQYISSDILLLRIMLTSGYILDCVQTKVATSRKKCVEASIGILKKDLK